MLDGAVAAVVAGPVSMPSEEWVGFYTVMKLRVLAWSRLLSPNTIEHALLLPILIHSVDDDGRPLRVPPSSSLAEMHGPTFRPSLRPCVSFGCRPASEPADSPEERQSRTAYP